MSYINIYTGGAIGEPTSGTAIFFKKKKDNQPYYEIFVDIFLDYSLYSNDDIAAPSDIRFTLTGSILTQTVQKSIKISGLTAANTDLNIVKLKVFTNYQFPTNVDTTINNCTMEILDETTNPTSTMSTTNWLEGDGITVTKEPVQLKKGVPLLSCNDAFPVQRPRQLTFSYVYDSPATMSMNVAKSSLPSALTAATELRLVFKNMVYKGTAITIPNKTLVLSGQNYRFSGSLPNIVVTSTAKLNIGLITLQAKVGTKFRTFASIYRMNVKF